MAHDVFISYSNRNKQTADAICHVLEQHKIKCWIAPRNISVGQKYGEVIEEAIRSCKVFIIIFSKESSVSPWVESELNVAFTDRRVVMPFRIDETNLGGEMRLILNNKHWIDAYPDPEAKFDELLQAVARQVGISIVTPSTKSEIEANTAIREEEPKIAERTKEPEKPKDPVKITANPPTAGIKQGKKEEPTLGRYKNSIVFAIGFGVFLFVMLVGYINHRTPQDSIDHYIIGNDYYNNENYDKAIECYQKAVSIDPEYTSAYFNMGIAYRKQENYDKAIECYQKAVSLNTKHAFAYFNMGDSYGEQKNYDKAIECYQKAISIDPKYVNAYISMGTAYGEQKNHSKAIECYQKAARLGSSDCQKWLKENGYTW